MHRGGGVHTGRCTEGEVYRKGGVQRWRCTEGEVYGIHALVGRELEAESYCRCRYS